MQDVTCPIDDDHVQDIVHGKTGHFKYVPNGEADPMDVFLILQVALV